MAVYNEEDYVAKAIVSVMEQTYKPFQFIIVNDGSTDKTADILKEATERYPEIKVINKNNSGLTKSLNFGLHHCTGDYIARLDGNDTASPEDNKSNILMVSGVLLSACLKLYVSAATPVQLLELW